MADTKDSKSFGRKAVPVQVRGPVLQARKGLTTTGRESFFLRNHAVPVFSQHGRYAFFSPGGRPSFIFGGAGTCGFWIAGLSCLAMLMYRWVVE